MVDAAGENVETVAQRASERIAEAANHHAFMPRDAERTIFEATGYAEVATEVSDAARRIGEDAKRSDLSVYDSVPAGGVIIGDFADPKNWVPRELASKASQLEDPTRSGAS